jgi:hypothetical protein
VMIRLPIIRLTIIRLTIIRLTIIKLTIIRLTIIRLTIIQAKDVKIIINNPESELEGSKGRLTPQIPSPTNRELYSSALNKHVQKYKYKRPKHKLL